ncbi:cell wall hydrolase [Novosphingobium sp. B 225]|uniref:cell wall hydrolase n=1 Tax=Novosphingobium sp. B 225 TaxID=1961849 RepID=UPI000B4B1F80|nr:cell wall hydrolase [Novosphingobium sp. B 225]
MPVALIRKLSVAALAILPVLALLALCRQFGPLPDLATYFPAAPADQAASLAALPGRAADAPLLQQSILPPGDAQARNAAVPFYAGPVLPADPFRFAGSETDRTRAADCLALAAMAEAGPSDEGQRAVIQVVLNRVRHPAFAKTVCGVVFEGSERATGCQFSFTCDGSLARRYSEQAWEHARLRAAEALGGRVFALVGNATHYHTDWVFPYWSPSLVKLARVETHLFFRWPGYWGTNAAMRTPYRGGEPDVSQPLPGEAPAPLATPGAQPTVAPGAPAITGGTLTMRDPTGKGNFVTLDPGSGPAEAMALARKLCGAATTCRVLAWADRAEIPATFPLPRAARAALLFSYTRDPAGSEIALYDCTRINGVARDQCIPKAR